MRLFVSTRRRALLLAGLTLGVAAVSISACSDNAATLSISVAPASLSVDKGASGTTVVTVDRGGSFSGSVALATSGGPTSITVGFTSVPSGTNTSTATVTVAADAVSGSYPLTITATGSGVPDATTILTVTVP